MSMPNCLVEFQGAQGGGAEPRLVSVNPYYVTMIDQCTRNREQAVSRHSTNPVYLTCIYTGQFGMFVTDDIQTVHQKLRAGMGRAIPRPGEEY